jgi:metal-responsive CopG/Arc/MetJ family transcriptional regulator
MVSNLIVSISKDALAEIDAARAAMPVKPTRSAFVREACTEFIKALRGAGGSCAVV